MSELWFTADLHLGHRNILKYCQRPFLTEEETRRAQEDPRGSWRVSGASVERHDEAILSAINERVGREDVLWILGDFSLEPLEVARAYRERIRCETVHLVWGNHDLPAYRELFDRVIDQGMIKHSRQKIWLNHYPMRSWDKSFHGAWHLYGHVHGRLAEEDAENPRLLVRDVGIDATNYAPVSFTELKQYMALREEAFWEWRREIERRSDQDSCS